MGQLARCDLHSNDFSSAREHAQRAHELGREKAIGAQLLTSQAPAGLGEYKQASGTLSAYLQDHPQDARAERIRGWIAELERAAEAAATPTYEGATATLKTAEAASADALPAALPTKDSWAPPDADATVPSVVPGALSTIITTASRASRMISRTSSILCSTSMPDWRCLGSFMVSHYTTHHFIWWLKALDFQEPRL